MSENVYQGDDFDQKVRKQVEFYFSDSNLQTDKFLWRIYEANDGWVELKTILTFGRMRQYRPEEKVIEALKKSDKLTLSSNNEMIRRTTPLKDFNELKNNRKRNTIHIEGFPSTLSQEDIEEFFATKVFDHLPEEKEVNSIRRIRNRNTKEFFGVVDVEFKTTKDAEFFLNELEISYPEGLVKKDDESVDKKDVLKKMSLLTFQEMRENSKRFGVNEVTKRKNSFNSNKDVKKFRKNSTTKKSAEETKEESENKEASEDVKEETKEAEEKTEAAEAATEASA